MGLDITAYGSAQPTNPPEDDQDYPSWIVHVFQENGFGHSLRGLSEGWYHVGGTALSFRAGSYSGYNAWRASLCKAALGVDPETVWNDESYADKPFYELIHFSDCEGSIGPDAAADLYADFVEHRERIVAQLDEYEAAKYDEWLFAFKVASGRGLVEFH